MSDSALFLNWRDVVDILTAAILFWGAITWFRKTRALLAFAGLAILMGVYLLARQLELNLTAWIFQGFAAVLLLLVVVVFQDDVRRLFEQIGRWGLRRGATPPASEGSDVIVRSVARLALTKTGALIVLPGREPLDRHLDGGIVLEGRLSEPLLLSLFDPHSPGHDGAVLVAGNRVVKFAVHLPLSADHAQLRDCGTRHAAALGLAERSDAMAIVVSEERGVVSVAHEGHLRSLRSAQELNGVLRHFATLMAPKPKSPGRVPRLIAREWISLTLSVLLAGSLWFLLGPGSGPIEVTRTAEVLIENLPGGYELESVDPPTVTIVASGPRRRLYLGRSDDFRVRIDALLAQLGRRTFQISAQQVERPPETQILEITPSVVRLSLHQTK